MTAMGTAGVRSRRTTTEQHAAFPARGVLVLHTDGLSTRWTLDGRTDLLRQPPDVIAAALWRDHCRSSDDSLVLVVRASDGGRRRVSSHELLRLHLDETRTATSLRHVGRRAALLLGLDDIDATRVSTSISELGRVAESGGRPVEVSLRIERGAPAGRR